MIEEHRGAIEYDWRSRLGLPLSVVGTDAMSWGETVRLVNVLLSDPSSMLAARAAGWDHPISREALILMDLFDLQHMAKSKRKPKPYPRPWPAGEVKRRGKTKLNRAQVVAVLNEHGHALAG